jgi:hypothetical protein
MGGMSAIGEAAGRESKITVSYWVSMVGRSDRLLEGTRMGWIFGEKLGGSGSDER